MAFWMKPSPKHTRNYADRLPTKSKQEDTRCLHFDKATKSRPCAICLPIPSFSPGFLPDAIADLTRNVSANNYGDEASLLETGVECGYRWRGIELSVEIEVRAATHFSPSLSLS